MFLAVVDEGSFAAAADMLGISQPSVSNHILALERAIGGPAFRRRKGRTPLLTDIGRSVLDHAREIVGGATELRTDVVRLKRSQQDRVVFSCQRSVANFSLKAEIVNFALENEKSELVVRIGKQEDVAVEINDGIADVGCYLSDEEPRGTTSEVIGRQRLVLVASPRHELARRRKISAAVLSKARFVGPPPTSYYGRAVMRLLRKAGIESMNVVAQATEFPFIREMVLADVGISCSPYRNVEADIQAGRLCALDFHGELALDVRLIQSAKREHSESVRRFTEYLRRCRFE